MSIWIVIVTFPGRSDTPENPIDVFRSYTNWIKSWPIIYEDFDVAASLLALGALTLAIFLSTGATNSNTDTTNSIAMQAQRVILAELSAITAALTAMGAWFTIPLAGFTLETVPEIFVATGIAALCSAVIPLHLAQPIALRLTLHETLNEQNRLYARQYYFARQALSTMKDRRFYRHYIVTIVTWSAIVATLPAFIAGISYQSIADNPTTFPNVMVIFATFLAAGAWAWFTASSYGQAIIGVARVGRPRGAFLAIAGYAFITSMTALLTFAVVLTTTSLIWASIITIPIFSVFTIIWILTYKYTNVLNGYVDSQIETILKSADQHVDDLKRNLLEASPIQ